MTVGVHLIAATRFDAVLAEQLTGWSTDADGGPALAEFAGRACYQSWSKPNLVTATNAGYLAHIIEVGHWSVLEHGVATFYLTGVSRALTHELVRHRHFSYSQLSQRFVDESDVDMVVPPAYRGDLDAEVRLDLAMRRARQTYGELVQLGQVAGLTRKQSREAARSVLPNMTETKIVVTGNYRAWREFIPKRDAAGADAEIRAVAAALCAALYAHAPAVFADLARDRREEGK